MLRALNPTARLLSTVNSQVEPHEVLLTGLWSPEKAPQAAAWVQLLQQQQQQPAQLQEQHQHDHDHIPGVSHFVYRSRRAFHPQRLHDFMVKFFVLQQPDWARLRELGGSGGGAGENSSSGGGSSDSCEGEEDGPAGDEGAGSSTSGAHAPADTTAQQLQALAAGCRAALSAAFGGLLLRSKGFVWLASRGDHIGEWSQAGSLLNFSTGVSCLCVRVCACACACACACGVVRCCACLACVCFSRPCCAARAPQFPLDTRARTLCSCDTHLDTRPHTRTHAHAGGPWFAVLPRDAWPAEQQQVDAIERDFVPGLGDRRQELVFIGECQECDV
jgi:hypothetical protein